MESQHVQTLLRDCENAGSLTCTCCSCVSVGIYQFFHNSRSCPAVACALMCFSCKLSPSTASIPRSSVSQVEHSPLLNARYVVDVDCTCWWYQGVFGKNNRKIRSFRVSICLFLLIFARKRGQECVKECKEQDW